jgi:hypothetical protein
MLLLRSKDPGAAKYVIAVETHYEFEPPRNTGLKPGENETKPGENEMKPGENEMKHFTAIRVGSKR